MREPQPIVPSPHHPRGPISAGLSNLLIPSVRQATLLFPFLPQAVQLKGQINNLPENSAQKVHLSLGKVMTAGLIGGVLYDVTSSRFGRTTAQLHTARIVSTTWVIDYLIDDFGMTNPRKIEVLQKLRETLLTSREQAFADSPQLTLAARKLARLGRALAHAPNPAPLRDAATTLMSAAIDQMQKPPTLATSIAIGEATGRSLGIVPYGWNSALSERFVRSMGYFGAYLQLFDDLYDVEHDRKNGIRTFATESGTLTCAENAAATCAKQLIFDSVAVLRPHERWSIELLHSLAARFWMPLRHYAEIAPRPFCK